MVGSRVFGEKRGGGRCVEQRLPNRGQSAAFQLFTFYVEQFLGLQR